MTKLLRFFALGLFLVPIFFTPLHAQMVTNAPIADTNSVAASPSPTNQAPDDVAKKLSGLVHDGKYAEAQQLAAGLLLAYPDDQRLIKGKALLDKLLATSNSSQPTNIVTQPAASGTSEQLTGMDKVDYNALLQRARDAQQTTDLAQQKTLLKQFMTDSSQFLQKHPDQMTLWEFRVAAALILNDPDAGYEAGQKLLTADAADSNDPKMQQLMAQLKNKGWLDAQRREAMLVIQKKFAWLLGTWDVHTIYSAPDKTVETNLNKRAETYRGKEEFILKESIVEGYRFNNAGVKNENPDLRGGITDAGEINWEFYIPLPNHSSDWYPAVSCKIDKDNPMMKIAFPTLGIEGSDPISMKYKQAKGAYVFTKISDAQN